MLALLLFGLIIFSPALLRLPFPELADIHFLKPRPASRPDVQVWVSKRSGVYYCPQSKKYGTIHRVNS
jgi:hypothetical protein